MTICEKHIGRQTTGLCAICLLEERNRLCHTLAGIAEASFCRDPNCTIDDPHCDAMIAKAAIQYLED